MKKLLLLLVTLTYVLTLSSCKSNTDEPYVFDVPKEYAVNLQNLSYATYFSLNNPVVTITVKDIGDIVIQLFPSVAPNTVNSFIQYIQDGDFDNNEFHRVVNEVLIQGGKLESQTCTIPGEMAANEFENELEHEPGVISMARVGEDYNSATSQFFILLSKTQDLDGAYASFGGVVSGFHIIQYIASLQSLETETPIAPIIITSMTVDLKSYEPVDRVCND